MKSSSTLKTTQDHQVILINHQEVPVKLEDYRSDGSVAKPLKRVQFCSICIKVFALLFIVGSVVFFIFLPTIIRNQQREAYASDNTDPTNAILPSIDSEESSNNTST